MNEVKITFEDCLVVLESNPQFHQECSIAARARVRATQVALLQQANKSEAEVEPKTAEED